MLTLALGRAATMARVPAGLPAGIRVSDHISLGAIARTFPIGEVRRGLAETGRGGERGRGLPAPRMGYYALALALYMPARPPPVLRCPLGGGGAAPGRPPSWSTPPPRWRSTGPPAPARCCAACWRGCAGSGAPRRSGWRARAASRRPVPGWARRRCAASTIRWCGRWRRPPPRALGTGGGGGGGPGGGAPARPPPGGKAPPTVGPPA